MAKHEIMVHEVEFLSISKANIDDEPVVIITIRPELPSFRPHNLAIARSQADRLLADLKTILSRSAVCLLLLAFAGLTGCSADVEVERETISPKPEAGAEVLAAERSRTAVAKHTQASTDTMLHESVLEADRRAGTWSCFLG